MITVIGLGVGLAPHELPKLPDADVLVAGNRQLALYPDFPGPTFAVSGPLDELIEAIRDALDAGLRVLVAVDGDPLFFGLGERLTRSFPPELLEFRPAATAVQAAAARLGRSWREWSVVSLHGREDFAPLFNALTWTRTVAAYTDPANTPAAVARRLLERGLDRTTAHVFEDMGQPGERLTSLPIEELAEFQASPLNLLVMEQDEAPTPLPLSRPDDFYMREANLMTKGPVRAAVLHALQPAAGQTLWDLGAGSGAVSIEAAAMVCRGHGRVLAVERSPERVEMARVNVRRARAWGVEVVQGDGLERVNGLAAPDRVFIGGGLSGESGAELLASALFALKPGGRLVASCALLSTLETVRSTLAGLRTELAGDPAVGLVHPAESQPLAGDVRLVSLNPVFLAVAEKS